MDNDHAPNTWDGFYAFLDRTARAGNRELFDRLQELRQAARLNDNENFPRLARELIHAYAEEYGKEHPFSLERDEKNTFEEALAWGKPLSAPTTSGPVSNQETPPPQTSTLASILPKKSENHGGGSSRPDPKDIASEKLKQTQKIATINAFKHLLDTTSEKDLPDAIENFYRTHLSAAGILGNQYKILQAQAQSLYADKKDLTQQLDELSKQGNARLAPLLQTQNMALSDEALRNQSQELLNQRKTEQYNAESIKAALRGQPQNADQTDAMRSLALQRLGTAFDNQWQSVALDDAVRQFGRYGFSYNTTIDEGYEDTVHTAIEHANYSQQQPEAIPQRSFQGSTQQKQNGRTGQLVNQAGNAVRNAGREGRKLANTTRKGEELVAGAAARQGGFEGLALLLGIDPEVLLGIIIILVAVVIILGLILAAAFIIILLSNTPPPSGGTAPIPGLTLTLTTDPSGKTTYLNGQNIKYLIDINYTGQYSLVITDQIPTTATIVANSITGQHVLTGNSITWNLDANTPLPNSTASNKHWEFNVTLTPTEKDIILHNQITAAYALGSGPPGLNQSTTANTTGAVRVGQPVLASGSCSPTALAPFFGGQKEGTVASCICKHESGGDPGIINSACLRGGTKDYSVGLFQINLLAHGDLVSRSCAQNISYSSGICKIANQSLENSCANFMKNPTNNVKAAVSLYRSAGNNWDGPWHAEKGKCF